MSYSVRSRPLGLSRSSQLELQHLSLFLAHPVSHFSPYLAQIPQPVTNTFNLTPCLHLQHSCLISYLLGKPLPWLHLSVCLLHVYNRTDEYSWGRHNGCGCSGLLKTLSLNGRSVLPSSPTTIHPLPQSILWIIPGLQFPPFFPVHKHPTYALCPPPAPHRHPRLHPLFMEETEAVRNVCPHATPGHLLPSCYCGSTVQL